MDHVKVYALVEREQRFEKIIAGRDQRHPDGSRLPQVIHRFVINGERVTVGRHAGTDHARRSTAQCDRAGDGIPGADRHRLSKVNVAVILKQ